MDNTKKTELERRVDEVLFYLWDPFGFNGEPYTRNDYRGYTKEIYTNLVSGSTANQLANLLIEIVEERMGLNMDRERSIKIGKLLVRHKNAIESE